MNRGMIGRARQAGGRHSLDDGGEKEFEARLTKGITYPIRHY